VARADGRWASVGLLLAAALLAASTVWWGVGPHDEGLMLQAARRIGDGQWPYRDFWWNYGPGQPVLLAPFGGSVVAWRVIRVLLAAATSLFAYRLARQHGASPWAAGLAFVAVAGAMAWPATPGPNPAALALGLGALVLAPARPLPAGALAGLAAVFRPEIGIAAALGLRDARAIGVAAAVAVLGWLPFLLVAPGDLVDQTVGFLGIQGLQRVPFPLDADTLDPNKLLEFYAPLILVAGAGLAAFVRPPLALVPLVLAGLLYLLGRTDEFHLVPLAAVLPIVLVSARRLRPAALVVVTLIALHGLDRIATQDRDVAAWEASDQVAALRDFIGDRSLFVAPPRFDQVTVGNPLLYVLAEKDNPTRYDVLQPGVVTTEEVQREMRDDLERARPELLVRWRDPRTAPEDNGSGVSSGVTLLDDYLRTRYRRVARFGAYEVHERRGA
jgi:hypothetical protein